ncbi:MAG: hypothetical protein QG600_338 [Patescibacteria group bacterium]|jgi:prepilin-type N-terminal cleavage/methylation domain-containing protein|nr:hypothetical protein [Patescibacteria group bacterium]
MKKKLSQGFTFVELLLVMSVIAILTTFVSLALVNSRASTSLETVSSTFMADFKNQQVKAMSGDTEGRGMPDHYGIYFDSDAYILFHGSSYNSSDDDNFSVPMDNSVTISTTFANDTVHFATQSGEITGFSEGQNTVTFSDASVTKSKTFIVNKYGVFSEEN